MDIRKTSIALSTLLAATTFSGVATAYEAGDIVVRAGVTSVNPQDSSDSLALNGAVIVLPSGEVGLEVDDDVQLGLTAEYMLTRNWGVELLAATPFDHTATGTGALSNLDIADAKQLPPTLSAVYHFDTTNEFQPYVGIGINYTVFFEEDVTDEANATFATLGLTGGDVELEDSIGVSVQIGADYHISESVLVNASMRWIDIETEAEVTFDGGNKITGDVSIDPVVYTVAVGYKF